MIDIEAYKQFMGITSFPEFDIEHFDLDISLSQYYFYFAKAGYDRHTGKHILKLPNNRKIPRHILFHELTHIYDHYVLEPPEDIPYFLLSGYLEYHAAQVELMAMLGADSIKDKISFSMNGTPNQLYWSTRKNLENKIDAAQVLISDKETKKRYDGLSFLYNFLGMRSICIMYAEDFTDDFEYNNFTGSFGTYIIPALREYMVGWDIDINLAAGLHFNVLKSMMSYGHEN